MASEDTNQVIRGRTQTLNYFAARLDAMNQGDLDDHLAVEGSLRALRMPEPDDDDNDPCAILYDGFQKICVLQLGIGSGRMVDRIMLSARESTLRRAWPIEPPAFRENAIIPQLAASFEER